MFVWYYDCIGTLKINKLFFQIFYQLKGESYIEITKEKKEKKKKNTNKNKQTSKQTNKKQYLKYRFHRVSKKRQNNFFYNLVFCLTLKIAALTKDKNQSGH